MIVTANLKSHLKFGGRGPRNHARGSSEFHDPSVMLHLARKTFYPAKLPFLLLHVDLTWIDPLRPGLIRASHATVE